MGNSPTDAELWQLHMQMPGVHKNPIDFARAVLAKWGTPPAVAGEPIGHLYCGGSYGDELADWEIVADQHQCDKLNEHHGALGKEAKLPIYAAPQPTQTVPPAGREPLTEEQRSDIATAAAGYNWTDDYVEAIDYVIDGVECLHGIKGGQHGTE